jgi:hypothetical protein
MSDTDPSITPDGIDEPTTHELLARLITRVECLTTTVDAAREDVRHARHAIAVIADGEMVRRQEMAMVVERLDTLDAEGCSARRVLHRGGNGGAE